MAPPNERLRVAMVAKHLSIEALARAVGVDPKTAQRWLKGRRPHPRTRWQICDLLGEPEDVLWPNAGVGTAAGATTHTSEIAAAYARRSHAPLALWSRLLDRATTQIDLLGYAILFFPEQHPSLPRLIQEKCSQGLMVRIALADPDCAEVAARDALEDLGGTLPGRIRTTLKHFSPILGVPGVEIRLHEVPLYNAVYRFDEHMLVTPYLLGLHGFQHPMLHLRRLAAEGIFESYAQQFDMIWAMTKTNAHLA